MAGIYRDFIASLAKHGFSKTSHFRFLTPTFDTVTKGQFSGMDELLSLRCEATEFPGRQLISNDSRIYGPSYKTPYQSVYQEITLNFIETENFLIRQYFELWMDLVFNSTTNRLSYPNEYRVDTTLEQFDVSDGSRPNSVNDPEIPNPSLLPAAEWNLYNSFPTAINQMPVSWAEDGLHRVTVTLAFEWYTMRIAKSSDTSVKPQSQLSSPPAPPRGSARS